MNYFLSILISIGAFAHSFSCYAQQKSIPEIHFSNTDNVPVGKKDIPKNKPLLIVYFRSDCDHCQQTATSLRKTGAQYLTEIWMISGEEMEPIRTFEEMLDLYDINNLKVLRDQNHEMHRFYNFTKLPFVLLYSQTGKLIKQFEALPTAAEVRKILTGK